MGLWRSRYRRIGGHQEGKIVHQLEGKGREIIYDDGSYKGYDNNGILEQHRDVKAKCVRWYHNGRLNSRYGLGGFSGILFEREKGRIYKTRKKNGRTVWRSVLYPNGSLYYKRVYRKKRVDLRAFYPDRKLKGILKPYLSVYDCRYDKPFSMRLYRNGQTAYEKKDGVEKWFFPNGKLLREKREGYLLQLTRKGRVKDKIVEENNQRVGACIEDFKKLYYIAGQPVPRTLFTQKPEDMTADQILNEENVNLRAGLLKKMGNDRLKDGVKRNGEW